LRIEQFEARVLYPMLEVPAPPSDTARVDLPESAQPVRAADAAGTETATLRGPAVAQDGRTVELAWKVTTADFQRVELSFKAAKPEQDALFTAGTRPLSPKDGPQSGVEKFAFDAKNKVAVD